MMITDRTITLFHSANGRGLVLECSVSLSSLFTGVLETYLVLDLTTPRFWVIELK